MFHSFFYVYQRVYVVRLILRKRNQRRTHGITFNGTAFHRFNFPSDMVDKRLRLKPQELRLILQVSKDRQSSSCGNIIVESYIEKKRGYRHVRRSSYIFVGERSILAKTCRNTGEHYGYVWKRIVPPNGYARWENLIFRQTHQPIKMSPSVLVLII
jgi:hypothetical protein